MPKEFVVQFEAYAQFGFAPIRMKPALEIAAAQCEDCGDVAPEHCVCCETCGGERMLPVKILQDADEFWHPSPEPTFGEGVIAEIPMQEPRASCILRDTTCRWKDLDYDANKIYVGNTYDVIDVAFWRIRDDKDPTVHLRIVLPDGGSWLLPASMFQAVYADGRIVVHNNCPEWLLTATSSVREQRSA